MQRIHVLTIAAASLAVGGWLAAISNSSAQSKPTTAEKAPAAEEIAALRAEVERLKKIVPDQAHAMADVDYHFSNLWFAGKAGNWPLAEFLWKESLAHLKWAVRIIPVRKDKAGQDVKLEDILQAMENTFGPQMEKIIASKDGREFERTYRMILENCYACHKASDKPYLRPRIPEHSASTMINVDPAATWPQ